MQMVWKNVKLQLCQNKLAVCVAVLCIFLVLEISAIVCLMHRSTSSTLQDYIVPVIYDTPRPIVYEFPPYYYQFDNRWASQEYAGATIEKSGCGLCAAASALSFYTQQSITPMDLYNQVGSSCTVNGVNDMRLFLEHFSRQYNIKHSDIYWLKDEAYEALNSELLVFAGVNGQIGPEYYTGHIVLMWKQYGHINVMDSASETFGGMTDEEFFESDFVYFYSMNGPVNVQFSN